MHEFLDHTADLEVRVVARDLDGVFAEAGVALFEIIAGDVMQIVPRSSRTFAMPATAPHDLLHDWLTALHAGFEVEGMLFHDFVVHVRRNGLRATARGERHDPQRHFLAHEVKAVTRHRLAIRPTAGGWEATFVVDI